MCVRACSAAAPSLRRGFRSRLRVDKRLLAYRCEDLEEALLCQASDQGCRSLVASLAVSPGKRHAARAFVGAVDTPLHTVHSKRLAEEESDGTSGGRSQMLNE